MKIAIMQPYSFPYLGYFQLVNSVDVFLFLDDVSFINKGWINRNFLLVNGKSFLFTFPCEKVSVNKKIMNTNIFLTEKSIDKFLKTIKHSYRKAPNFVDVFSLIENIMYSQYTTIAEFSELSIKIISDYLDINTKFGKVSEKYSEIDSTGSKRIIDICQKQNCVKYINLIGGQNLYNKKEFETKGIELKFIQSDKIYYRQFNSDFIPNLSIIDVLMFNDIDEVKILLSKYRLT